MLTDDHDRQFFIVDLLLMLAIGLPRALEYYTTTVIVYYLSTVLAIFYSRFYVSISSCRFLQSVNEFLEFIETWGFAISFAHLPT